MLICVFLITSCKEEEENVAVFDQDYGEGMYIVTEFGVSFYNNNDSLAQVQNKIFKTVNNRTIINPKKIKFYGTKAYILADDYIETVNVKTFQEKETINGFLNPVDLDYVSNDRLFVIDKDDSKVKTVDMESLDIASQIETGDSTKPVFIVSNSYKSFIMNGGGSFDQIKDSTVIVIEYKDNLVALADFIGSLSVGDNPNSAVITSSGALKVLCKGSYDPINSVNNTESLLSDINQYSNQVYSTNTLTGIYNAGNLISNWDNNFCYFTAVGGIYKLNPNNLNINLIVNVNSSVINTVIESFSVNDSTTVSYEMLYMNDLDNTNTIYKYNSDLSVFVDTIIVDGNVRDINFY